MTTVTMELPDEMISFAMPQNKEEQLMRNAMILYPYIQQGRVSHGRAEQFIENLQRIRDTKRKLK